MGHRPISLTGRRFERWLVLGPAGTDPASGQMQWLCRCDCGTERVILGQNLRTGRTRSCGCIQGENADTEDRLHKRARIAVHRAVRLGVLIQRACAVCGDPKTEAHHHRGYSPEHWLDVIWLCSKHHAATRFVPVHSAFTGGR